jgi:CRISPR-associated protein Cas1
MNTRKTLLIDQYGAILGVKEGQFQVRIKEGNTWKVIINVSPVELDSITITVPSVSITAAAIELAAKYGLDLTFITKHKPIARLIPATYGSTLRTWIKQIYHTTHKDRRTKLAQAFIEGKIHNQRIVLQSFYKTIQATNKDDPTIKNAIEELKKWEIQLTQTKDWKEVGQIEAKAAQEYWKAIKKLIPQTLGFQKRLKKWDLPPEETPDPFNIALNIGYSILAKEVWKATFIANLNPYIGFLHAKRPGRISLVYDLMEEFRPIAVDRPLIKLARKEPQTLLSLKETDTEQTRKTIQTIWKTILENLRTTKPPLTQQITTQARKLAQALLQNTEYKPYKAEW